MTAMNNPYEAYRQNQYQTATQGELLLMLCRGALDFMAKAKETIDNRDIVNSHHNLKRVQKIILELMVSVDRENGGQAAENLISLYEYMYHRLVKANVKKDKEIVEEVERLFRPIKEAWEEALNTGSAAAPSAGGATSGGANNPYAADQETSSISFKG